MRKLLDSRLARIQGLKPIQESEDQDRKWLILNPEKVRWELVLLFVTSMSIACFACQCNAFSRWQRSSLTLFMTNSFRLLNFKFKDIF